MRLFAQRQREAEEVKRRARREAKAVRAEEAQRQALMTAKDEAAAELKRARRSGVGGAALAAADAAYRAALEAVLVVERGGHSGP